MMTHPLLFSLMFLLFDTPALQPLHSCHLHGALRLLIYHMYDISLLIWIGVDGSMTDGL